MYLSFSLLNLYKLGISLRFPKKQHYEKREDLEVYLLVTPPYCLALETRKKDAYQSADILQSCG